MPDPDPKRIDPDRLAHALLRYADDHGLSQEDLAAAIGVSQPAVSDWINARSRPGRKNARRIFDLLDVDPHTLLAAPDEPTPTTLPTDAPANAAALTFIPHDGAAAAGDGSTDRTPSFYGYPTRVMEQLTGFADPERLRSFTIVGDSLAPEIAPHTPAVYFQTHRLIGDGLYVLLVDDTVVVKRVQLVPGGMLILSGFNPAYREIELEPLPDADTPGTFRERSSGLITYVQVIGKVMHYPKTA